MSFSIERESEKIYDTRTRQYFREVLSSYINENYRSATVMLWSVVVSDLVYKLKELRDIYGDGTSKDILRKIEELQEKDPYTSKWEKDLVEEIWKRSQLLDNAEYQSIENLLANRHLSAHPVLSKDDILFSPNRDAVRAMIRSALEGVLLKPPILSRGDIVGDLVADIAERKDFFVSDKDLKQYIEAKYLKNLSTPAEASLFKNLWKFVFILSNEQTNANREINFRALRIVFSRSSQRLLESIKDQRDFFSNIGNDEALKLLIQFLFENPNVYEFLSDAARIPLKRYARRHVHLDPNPFILSSFSADSLDAHLDAISDMINGRLNYQSTLRIKEESWKLLVEHAQEEGLEERVYNMGADIYTSSGDFSSADHYFTLVIEPYLSDMTGDNLKYLLGKIEKNDQTYGRSQARIDHEKIRQRVEALFGSDFDWSRYPNFIRRFNRDLELPF